MDSMRSLIAAATWAIRTLLAGSFTVAVGPVVADDVPDPFLELWDQAVVAMDQAYGEWQKHAEQAVDSTEYTIEYLASIQPEAPRRLDTQLLMQADANRDKFVSRDESMRFLEIQLGIRWLTDDLLRMADGRVVDFASFLAIDRNRDSKLSADELAMVSSGERGGLASVDSDGDGIISLAEFASRKSPFLRDVVAIFQAADRSGDGNLDLAELHAATPDHRQHLIQSNLAAFDEDRDQQLSFTEYRVSMLGNYNYPWQWAPIDENRDRRLSFQEFKFHDWSLFQLQRRFYFHRLDLDQDGELSVDEFHFVTSPLQTLVRLSLSDSAAEAETIFHDEDYPICGSPDVSADGRWVLFDAAPPRSLAESVIRMTKIDGSEARDVCDGARPSWSPSGDRFACCRTAPHAGVWIMNGDGSIVKRIDDGSGVQWSPDGSRIAYVNDNSLLIYDVANDQSTTVLAKGTHPYRYLHPALAWSPDSRRLVFKGKIDDQQHEVAIWELATTSLTRRFASRESIADDFAWTVDGEHILMLWQAAGHERPCLCRLKVQDQAPPQIDDRFTRAQLNRPQLNRPQLNRPQLNRPQLNRPQLNRAWEGQSLALSRDGKWLILATPAVQLR
jgi:Ca2+-binding EF-hand superfamily protein